MKTELTICFLVKNWRGQFHFHPHCPQAPRLAKLKLEPICVFFFVTENSNSRQTQFPDFFFYFSWFFSNMLLKYRVGKKNLMRLKNYYPKSLFFRQNMHKNVIYQGYPPHKFFLIFFTYDTNAVPNNLVTKTWKSDEKLAHRTCFCKVSKLSKISQVS